MSDLIWSAYGFEIDGDKIWFVPYWYNFLCCYSLKNKKFERIEFIPEDNGIELSYANLVKVNDNIILIPDNASHICIYNICERSFWTKRLKGIEDEIDKFYAYGLWEDSIFFFAGKYPLILKLNLKKKEIKYIDDWKEKINTEGGILCFQFDYYVEKQKVYLLSAITNQIMIFDMESESVQVKNVGESTEIYSTIECFGKNTFLLTDQSGNCILTNLDNAKYEKIENIIEGFVAHRFLKERVCFSDSVRYGKWVYLIPGQANKILKFSIENKVIEEASIDNILNKEKIIDSAWQGGIFSMVQERNGWLYGFHVLKGVFFRINLETEQTEYYPIFLKELKKEELLDLLSDRLSKRCVVESDAAYASLKMLMELIQESKHGEILNPKKSIVGKRIFNALNI